MALTVHDEACLTFFFQNEGQYQRSTSGPMLERAALFGFTEEGKRIGDLKSNWAWGEHVMVPSNKRGAPAGGYMPKMGALLTLGAVSSRLRAIEHVNPRAVTVLEAYYGDRGARWAAFSADERNEKHEVVRPGTGPGSIAALYYMTESGKAVIRKEWAKREARKGADFTHDEVLASIFVSLAVTPDKNMVARMMSVRDDAETLLREAWAEWKRSGRKTKPGK